MHKFGSKAASVAVYVMGQYECLKIFNFGKPLHGLYLFEADEFKNWSKKFETLPIWFLNPPEIITNDIQKLVSGFERQTFIWFACVSDKKKAKSYFFRDFFEVLAKSSAFRFDFVIFRSVSGTSFSAYASVKLKF